MGSGPKIKIRGLGVSSIGVHGGREWQVNGCFVVHVSPHYRCNTLVYMVYFQNHFGLTQVSVAKFTVWGRMQKLSHLLRCTSLNLGASSENVENLTSQAFF